MSHRERLEAVFHGCVPDRTPVLGGWICWPEHIQALAGVSREEYWADPIAASISAYRALDTDGLVACFVPIGEDSYRGVDAESYVHACPDLSLEQALAQIDAMACADEMAAQFDLEAEYARYRQELVEMQARCAEIVWMPAAWGAGAYLTWYAEFGYENFFQILGGYPHQAHKLVQVGGVRGYNLSRLVARAVREGLYPHAVLLGEDICTQRGPMLSPAFLERFYAPALRRGLQPLLEVGCKPVWHSDGDVRPLLDMLIDCGVQGFQGFQPECGLTIDAMVQRRTREGQKLLIFGPLAVTTELPCSTPEEIRARVRHAIEVSRGNADLVLFTSNTINPDVPLENLQAMVEAVHDR